MKKFLKCGIICAFILLFLTSCSEKADEKSNKLNAEEIEGKYDQITSDINEDKPIDSSVSVFDNGFTDFDFTFTSSDDTNAFSIDENAFAKMTQGGTFYNYINPGSDVVTYESGFKTARGLCIGDTASDFLNAYQISDSKSLYLSNDENPMYYNPTNGVFTGKLTALYALNEDGSYVLLSDKDVQKFLYLRDADKGSAYMDTKKIIELFPDYKSVVSLDITSDENGVVTEFAVYRFCKQQ